MPGISHPSRLSLLALSFALTAGLAMGSAPPRTHVVRLEGNRFLPADSRVAAGDTVRFVNGQGGPHNVQFMAESIPATAHGLLNDAMRDRILPLTSPMFIVPDEAYTIIVPKLAPGRYAFLCSPHWANMRGALTVVPEE
jgi:plastocyanin